MKYIGTRYLDGIIAFFSNEHFLSNWYPANFEMNGYKFSNSEQAFIWQKAMLFQDISAANKALKTPDPREVKAIGRQIKKFDEDLWSEFRMDCMYRANLSKFMDNPKLMQDLIYTDGFKLVEASPYDRIWGCGLSADSGGITDESLWPGLNLLGVVLMDVRDELIQASRVFK